MMSNFKKSQIIILVILAALLLLTPLLSSSLRTKYLYFIINLLIIVLGAEAGLLSSLFYTTTPTPSVLDSKKTHAHLPLNSTTTHHSYHHHPSPEINKTLMIKVVDKSAISHKNNGPVHKIKKVKKCPSTPSLFFIGGAPPEEAAEENEHDIQEQEFQESAEINGQELFTKAETFIGNFYKQLKMQREDSWKRIHDFYHKPF
ncbi:hypothetical protein M5689_014361 [Euphorbia peplus]|nr:hypothetical protein M5689_014361 [Euphorbia peplus]